MAAQEAVGGAVVLGVLLATAGAAVDAAAPAGDIVGTAVSTGGSTLVLGMLGWRLVDVLNRMVTGVETIGASLARGVVFEHRHGGELVDVVRVIARRDEREPTEERRRRTEE
jgi:hypothetical protein